MPNSYRGLKAFLTNAKFMWKPTDDFTLIEEKKTFVVITDENDDISNFVLSYVFTFWVLCCDVCYDFLIKIMFCSSLPPVVCSLIYVILGLFAYSGVQLLLTIYIYE